MIGSGSRPVTTRFSWPAALLAVACAAAGSALALHYPLSGLMAMMLFVLATAAAWLRPLGWLVLLPALLPIIGFAPWTGWLTFEEFDLLVLAVTAGGYARCAWRTRDVYASQTKHPAGSNASALIGLMLALFAGSTLLAMMRGFADAGGFSFGWVQGYREPMNSLRLAKPLFATLLLWPLWRAAQRHDPQTAWRALSLGMTLGLLAASLAALWERVAFTGLLNFSADYRTTALFWEMHVGGAALDGYLALTMPFAVREMLVAQTKARWAFATIVTALGTYGCLTTFSRGVYLAVPVSLGLMWALSAAQKRRVAADTGRPQAGALVSRLALLLGFMLTAAWMFPGSGYRGMLALAGALALLLPLASALRGALPAELIAGALVGVVLSVTAAAVAWLMPKGPYIVYATGWAFAAGMLALQRRAARGIARHATALAWAGYLWVLTGLVLVTWRWGGHAALAQALPVALTLFVVAVIAGFSRRVLWPTGLRWQVNTLSALLLSSGLVTAFGGGAFMGERFSTTEGDLAGRLAHWQLSASMLDGATDWLLGKGLGRYVESYAITAPESLRPGDYRLMTDARGPHLRLTGGGRLTGDPKAPMALGGDMLRVSQRIALPAGTPRLSFDVRASNPAVLGAGVCTKHLLYPAACQGIEVRAEAKSRDWQHVQVQLRGDGLSDGSWYAPQLVTFVIGVDSWGGVVDVDNLELVGADGRELLANGDFADGLSRWFFTSDRSHLPWHAKNMALHVLFDQGLIGLALLLALASGALWRTCLGSARGHSLSPTLAGAAAGFAVVGLFDSLLDVPRIGFLWYSLLLVMLTLPRTSTQSEAQ